MHRVKHLVSGNPYQPPSTPPEDHRTQIRNREDLRSVAIYQKGIIACILIYFMVLICQFLIPLEMRFILGIAILNSHGAGMVFVFLLAIKVYSFGSGVMRGILTLIPLIGLIELLLINGKATKTLKQNGIKVGLLGAKLSQI